MYYSHKDYHVIPGSSAEARRKMLLGVTGTPAASVVQEFLKEFGQDFEITMIPTKSALNFIPSLSSIQEEFGPIKTIMDEDGIDSYLGGLRVFTDDDPWLKWKDTENLPEQLGQWADVTVIAPATSNTLAKVATGKADNLLTMTIKEFPYAAIFIPDMSPTAWRAPSTVRSVETLKKDGHAVHDSPFALQDLLKVAQWIRKTVNNEEE